MKIKSQFSIDGKEARDKGTIKLELRQDLANAKYIYCVLSNGDVLFRTSILGDCNINPCNGALFVSKSIVLDMDKELEIVGLGLSGETNLDSIFVQFVLEDSLHKNRTESIAIECIVSLDWDGDVLLCAGDNCLIGWLLGLNKLWDKWQIALGDNTDKNTIFRAEQNIAIDAQVEYANGVLSFWATFDNQPIYELLLCCDGVPQLRKAVNGVVNTVLSKVDTGVVAFENQADTVINISINNQILNYCDAIRYGLQVCELRHNLNDLRLDTETKLIGDSDGKYICIVGKRQLMLLTKLQNGALDIILSIPNNDYWVDISSSGIVFLYSSGVFSVYYMQDGEWFVDSVAINGVAYFAVVTGKNDDECFVACVIGSDTIVYYYIKGAESFLQMQVLTDCIRVLKYGSSLLYYDDYFGETSYVMSGLDNDATLASMMTLACARQNVTTHYCGMFLYGDGVDTVAKYNTIHNNDMVVIDGRVWMCGCYLIIQDITDYSIRVVLYDRSNDCTVDIAKLKFGSSIVAVGRLHDYILIVNDKGNLFVLAHQNKHGWIVKYDLKPEDTITSGYTVKSVSGYNNDGNIGVRFDLRFV
ncbi:MAG: hypothetical protein FWF56_06810 [Firmicutes bacterium]|nr:hypothetical protein [Bacillota bacterium]MCL1953966.1 hypothetical protein [Bacillota bacterium]